MHRPRFSPPRPAGSRWAISILAGLALAGCGNPGSGPPPAPAGPNELGADAAPRPGTAAGPSVTPVAQVTKSATPGVTIPKDARYTIVCTSFATPSHVQVAKASKDNLVRATGRADFYVVHNDGESTLYFGYYREVEHKIDSNEADRAEKDLAFIRQLTDGQGRKLFPGSLKIAIPTPDPEAPLEYDLTHVNDTKAPDDPARRYWSIAIAAYTADGRPNGEDSGKSRKQLAVESVMAARKAGVEAYYYNGPSTSLVCVGAWPRAAIREQEANRAGSDADTNQEILVSPTPLPKSFTDKLQSSGHDIKVFQPKIEFNDPSLLNTWKQYPDYSVNGAVQITSITDPQTGKTNKKPQQSFLVEIPKPAASLLNTGEASGDTTVDRSGPGMPTGGFNPLAPSGGGGRLRSVTP